MLIDSMASKRPTYLKPNQLVRVKATGQKGKVESRQGAVYRVYHEDGTSALYTRNALVRRVK